MFIYAPGPTFFPVVELLCPSVRVDRLTNAIKFKNIKLEFSKNELQEIENKHSNSKFIFQ